MHAKKSRIPEDSVPADSGTFSTNMLLNLKPFQNYCAFSNAAVIYGGENSPSCSTPISPEYPTRDRQWGKIRHRIESSYPHHVDGAILQSADMHTENIVEYTHHISVSGVPRKHTHACEACTSMVFQVFLVVGLLFL